MGFLCPNSPRTPMLPTPYKNHLRYVIHPQKAALFKMTSYLLILKNWILQVMNFLQRLVDWKVPSVRRRTRMWLKSDGNGVIPIIWWLQLCIVWMDGWDIRNKQKKYIDVFVFFFYFKVSRPLIIFVMTSFLYESSTKYVVLCPSKCKWL